MPEFLLVGEVLQTLLIIKIDGSLLVLPTTPLKFYYIY